MLGTGDAGVLLQEKGLDVPLSNGQTAYFNYYWLRDNCPSSFDPETRERVNDIFALDEAPKAASAAIVGGDLEIAWAGTNDVSRLPLSLLNAYSNGEKRPDIANLQRVPWYADHYPKMARFSYDEVTNDTVRRRDWAKAMLTDGVALLTGLPDTDEALTDTAGLIGYVRPSYFGLTFEVKTHIKPTNLAFTAKALPLHTDLPDEDLAPGVQFLHCRANSVEGGNSIFVDGLAVAEDFRKAYPEDFELLITVDVPYFCEHDTFDMRSRQRVIELDEHGNISGVTISQHHADIFDMPQHELDRYYPAFCRFGRMMRDDKYLMRFRLNAGECIVFDNHRIVHGRAAYSATSGNRHLRGCYTDRGELRSTYRILSGEGRFK
ncbi:TauD/TfdA family dioxygenase [Roseibium aggregatum]|uniref:Gamma-butyrobetaine dioxygenase n=1 Tax=Roseibium aggregatum TaxID=187304 RepID=A0A0M6Y0S2_9HYPH|nr:TauD/TfdA family dioxygenase [Roseibium aggregatum]MEC9402951.1 TauD/TfdA family dioxygenase [Pseudomonadota bacterium]MEE2863626.1 TauD/TfdA family dioxygenase [Pseudomonadota bacterium]CTQ43294.1 Gamma-butyrobetaine dioxygenase [Roseibium aggregatum]